MGRLSKKYFQSIILNIKKNSFNISNSFGNIFKILGAILGCLSYDIICQKPHHSPRLCTNFFWPFKLFLIFSQKLILCRLQTFDCFTSNMQRITFYWINFIQNSQLPFRKLNAYNMHVRPSNLHRTNTNLWFHSILEYY